MGILGLILGVIALIISFVPFIGALALIPGIVAVVLATAGLMQAKKNHSSKSLFVITLVIAIAATVIASAWGISLAHSNSDKVQPYDVKVEINDDERDTLESELETIGNEETTNEKEEEKLKKLEDNLEQLEGKIDTSSVKK